MQENDLIRKYYRKIVLVEVLTSIVLSAIISAIIDWYVPGNIFIIIFSALTVWLLGSNYIQLQIVRKWVIKPMLKELQMEKYSFRKDKLTGLCRREVLEERKTEYESRYESIGILYVDINNLKVINDQFGHYAGDELISKVADAIRDLRTEYSELDHFRYGGDEFVIVVKDATDDKCHQLAVVLAEKIDHIDLKRSKGQAAKAAIGFAYSNENIRIQKLLGDADSDMYRNKKIMKKE